MKKRLLVILGGDVQAVAIAKEAMERFSPGAEVLQAATLDSALRLETLGNPGIFVALEGSILAAARVSAIRDPQHLPQWAVVARDEIPEGPEIAVVGEGDWKVDVLSHVFRLSWSRLLLQRENERFRGDLQSIGTRIVHDMRSPLGGILASTEALGEFLAEIAPAEVGRTQRILESEEDLLEIVRKLGVLAHDFAGPLVLGEFNMGLAVNSALERLEPEIIRARDTVTQTEVWPEVKGDQRKLERIWFHLLQNAVVHAGSARLIELGWEHRDGELRFSVGDNGAGVPAEKQTLLFWPFHRLHDPSAARGLGLPIAERLVRMHGGSTGYAPRANGGAVFYFTIPA
jgi:signal transduction histidine kinase